MLVCFYEEYKLRLASYLKKNSNVETKTAPMKLNYSKNVNNAKHEGNRTPDFQNRNLMLYPLSYMLIILLILPINNLNSIEISIEFKLFISSKFYHHPIFL